MIKKVLFAVCCILILVSCGSLRKPVVVKNAPLDTFKYAYVSATSGVTSGTGVIYGALGYSETKSINPSDVIAGRLIREGFVILPQFKPELSSQTLMVSYGETGRRSVSLGGYTIEVTIQFVSAETNQLVCSSTVEGRGMTEVDGIREAINRALDEVFPSASSPKGKWDEYVPEY